MSRLRRVVVGGSLAQRPFYGGHTWVLLQYLLGFRELGWEVLFLDRLEAGMACDAAGAPCPVEMSVNWRYLAEVMKQTGFDGSYAVAADRGRSWYGMEEAEVIRNVRSSELFVNIMGFVEHPAVLDAAQVKVFVDIDPGFGQMWKELGQADIFGGHDRYLTVGRNLGMPGCTIPTAGIDWVPILPPVVLSQWPVAVGDGGAFTSIGSWRGPFAPVCHEGRSYGLRVHEFRKFFGLPGRTGERFRASMEIDDSDRADIEQLGSNGWELQDRLATTGHPWRYRSYIQESRAEFLVAKGMYVDTSSGWVSDRSACFLATGKPVLAQDTGLSGVLPTDEGLLIFRTLEEAAEGVNRIAADYQLHAKAARELAEDYFDSRKVLTGLAGLVGAS